MKRTFTVVKFNKQDSEGDIILPTAIDTTKMPLLTHNFNIHKRIGRVLGMEIKRDELVVLAAIPEEHFNLTPALGFRVIKGEKRDGVRVIQEMELGEISLCDVPNVDPDIKPLNEQ